MLYRYILYLISYILYLIFIFQQFNHNTVFVYWMAHATSWNDVYAERAVAPAVSCMASLMLLRYAVHFSLLHTGISSASVFSLRLSLFHGPIAVSSPSVLQQSLGAFLFLVPIVFFSHIDSTFFPPLLPPISPRRWVYAGWALPASLSLRSGPPL